MSVDHAGTAAIEGTADQMWSQTVVDRHAEAAAVSAIASGSQPSTVRAIRPRIADVGGPDQDGQRCR
jgi:hypothetical protein